MKKMTVIAMFALALLTFGCATHQGTIPRSYVPPNAKDLPLVPGAQVKTGIMETGEIEIPVESMPELEERPNNDGYAEYLKSKEAYQGIVESDIKEISGTKSGPVESAPSSQPKNKVSKPAPTINTGAIWGEINQLKSRVTLIEERIDASPGVMKGMILEFRPGRTAITNDTKADLEKLIAAYTAGKIENIAIGIHTDRGTGSMSRNKALTAERGKNVKAFFQAKGMNIGEQALKAEITNRVNGPSLTVIYSVK